MKHQTATELADLHFSQLASRLNRLPAAIHEMPPEAFYVTAMRQLATPRALAPLTEERVASNPDPPRLNCSGKRYIRVLTGRQRSSPALIVDFVPFGYDLDLLEVRLHENFEHVSAFVVYEAEFTQRGVPKPVRLSPYQLHPALGLTRSLARCAPPSPICLVVT